MFSLRNKKNYLGTILKALPYLELRCNNSAPEMKGLTGII